ncbi:biliverdin-producing heme oxygenase [Streptomyces sp. HNM0663]|uniref:Biliverdin-producing heme oxygenase n=1 Tax=Streptomyces chengmaiensis TaxID=3040919 RepID=A0ABT6HWX8_9ACTN|nr:biliverdin-producing heme oxygenase [Streptomyces chengmaiensis]MDH2393207.1 biliverdin-producing heme oxygenase [Streptomyces chengmaiensis]
MDTPFSTLIRVASHEAHTEAETSTFMSDLLGGRLGVDAYTRYTEQLWFVYRALEEAAEALRDDPVAGPFIQPELMRTAELERDLAHLYGGAGGHPDGDADTDNGHGNGNGNGNGDWRTGLTPLPATAAYAARIAECARDWPAGYVAHHYTRYLGDLSGGQIIRDRAEKAWGFACKGDGVRFYVFEEIPNPAAFKRGYRELLDRVEVDDLEKQRIVEECKRAFAFNSAVFHELGARFPLSA